MEKYQLNFMEKTKMENKRTELAVTVAIVIVVIVAFE